MDPDCQSKLTNDQLSEAETSGLIATQLTCTLHHHLSGRAGSPLLVAAAGLSKIRWPDPEAYQNLMLHFAVGQRLSLERLAQDLTDRGFIRHRSALEPNSFRVRGEAVEIDHAALPEKISLTLHGSTLENITVAKDRRRKRLSRTSLPPVKFPPVTLSSEQFLSKISHQVVEPPAFSPVTRARAQEFLGELEEGRPAVHADHGIAIYEGLQTKTLGGTEQDYIVLQYAQGDVLFVPVTYAHKVTAYVGDHVPKLHRLGGTVWLKSKRRAKEEAAAFAKELLAVAGRRQASTREPYTLSERLEVELTESFPFALTPDQIQTWKEVKADLQKNRPADRVIVGDVGFGKTEIAIRAARHVAASRRQVAILAPTTLLVQQHFDTFQARLPDLFPHIALLSRFTSPKQARQTRRDIENGQAQIVIGTHALLSKHIHWKNLGLVIIDEEQKFGVRHKEHLKKMRSEIDVLSLSATPIPRTLALALSGLRDLSLIQTAPAGRKSVETVVALRSDAILKTAVATELRRGGQTYLVASKIRQLPAIQKHVAALMEKSLPAGRQAKIAVAHGRLPGKELARIMHAFDIGEIDVLVSSNIVENGLDLPRANTMLVWSAPDFGLADLYQLRGRVGRREEQGYAYLLYNQGELTSDQRKRLSAITEASRLGAGWSIARRDLEIRGTGNLLGKEQSGTANEVGVQLYVDLINQAAQDLSRAETPSASPPHVRGRQSGGGSEETNIELPLTAILPAAYIDSTAERAKWYQRLARATSQATLQALAQELEREFGPPPQAAKNLILLLQLQHAAQNRGLTKIDAKKISPPGDDPFFRVTLHGKQSTTLETPEITPAFVQELLTTLSR